MLMHITFEQEGETNSCAIGSIEELAFSIITIFGWMKLCCRKEFAKYSKEIFLVISANAEEKVPVYHEPQHLKEPRGAARCKSQRETEGLDLVGTLSHGRTISMLTRTVLVFFCLLTRVVSHMKLSYSIFALHPCGMLHVMEDC